MGDSKTHLAHCHYQKAKGFNRKAEKYTSLSLAEKKWEIFRAVK